jgi:L-asparaginase
MAKNSKKKKSYRLTHIETDVQTSNQTSILVIYTGGTFGMDYDKETNSLVPFDFSKILEKVPELKRFDFNLTILEPFPPIDSANITVKHWLEIAKIIYDYYDEYQGFVVLHGTDTMSYTASAVSFLLENLAKPVIFTGAQLPISTRRTDARENLIAALEIAASRKNGKPIVSEVCVFFDYTLLRANRSSKVQSMNFSAFKSINYPELAEVGIHINFDYAALSSPAIQPLKLYKKMEKQILRLTISPDMSQELTSSILSQKNIKGLVLETFGAGNIPTTKWFIALLKNLIDRGIYVYNISQSSGGRVMQGHYKTSVALAKMGVISGSDITAEAAITKMMFLLANEKSSKRLKKRLAVPICGEMSL